MRNRRKHKKFIDPRYFMDEKLEEADIGPGPADQTSQGVEPQVNDSGTNKKVLYAAAKQQIEEVLNTFWDDLDAGGVPNAQAELDKLMAQVQKDMDSGFVGEPT
tara:strand:- start:583 stop:894 length:312 start_codon:yes stop_codon:yes gene_type:complete